MNSLAGIGTGDGDCKLDSDVDLNRLSKSDEANCPLELIGRADDEVDGTK